MTGSATPPERRLTVPRPHGSKADEADATSHLEYDCGDLRLDKRNVRNGSKADIAAIG